MENIGSNPESTEAQNVVEVDTTEDSDNSLNEAQLISLTTNDVASADIQSDLLSANEREKTLVRQQVRRCLIDESIHFFDPLKKNKSKTFSNLYTSTVTTKNNEKKTLKADRKLIQQLFNASLAGRRIQMLRILTHELSKVPTVSCKSKWKHEYNIKI